VAPLEPPQLSVTLLLDVVGPGLTVLPGLVLVGVDGTETLPRVWKYSAVLNDEHPALLHAATFQRY
jgi:hypothetical protein